MLNYALVFPLNEFHLLLSKDLKLQFVFLEYDLQNEFSDSNTQKCKLQKDLY